MRAFAYVCVGLFSLCDQNWKINLEIYDMTWSNGENISHLKNHLFNVQINLTKIEINIIWIKCGWIFKVIGYVLQWGYAFYGAVKDKLLVEKLSK
jgi:hypothetical protein